MALNLQSLLPQILPNAIAWAEAQAQHVAEVGQPLSEADLELARNVGVQHPELIRVKLVDQIPRPTDPALLQAGLQAGLLGSNVAGRTFGHSILIRRDQLSVRILSHECRHVYQYEVSGSIAAFLPVYLRQIVTVGYHNAPLEQDARAHERNFV